MQQLTGSYMWHYVNNEEKIKGPKEDHEYLVCFERSTKSGSVWVMKLAFWFEKGAKITLMDSKGKPNKLGIDKDGFYLINDFDAKGIHFYMLNGVRYWTEIPEPGVNPDDVLSIV